MKLLSHSVDCNSRTLHSQTVSSGEKLVELVAPPLWEIQREAQQAQYTIVRLEMSEWGIVRQDGMYNELSLQEVAPATEQVKEDMAEMALMMFNRQN